MSVSKNNLWRMNIILDRMYRTKKITDNMYVYIKMLLENYEWPFFFFNEYDAFPDQQPNIEKEMLNELEDAKLPPEPNFKEEESIQNLEQGNENIQDPEGPDLSEPDPSEENEKPQAPPADEFTNEFPEETLIEEDNSEEKL